MSKKKNLFNFFINLLSSNRFIAIISVNKLGIDNKNELKLELQKIGLQSKVLKNNIFRKVIENKFPNYINILPLVQGFCILVYANDFEVVSLKSFQKFLTKNEQYLFLGGLFDGHLINGNFLKSIAQAKEPLEIFKEIIGVLNHPNLRLVQSLDKLPSTLMYLLQNKK